MSNAAQELFELLRNAKPSERMERKPVPPSAAPKMPLVPLYAALTPKRVELPALGGCVEILYDWDERGTR
jgi:hypothetical protein